MKPTIKLNRLVTIMVKLHKGKAALMLLRVQDLADTFSACKSAMIVCRFSKAMDRLMVRSVESKGEFQRQFTSKMSNDGPSSTGPKINWRLQDNYTQNNQCNSNNTLTVPLGRL